MKINIIDIIRLSQLVFQSRAKIPAASVLYLSHAHSPVGLAAVRSRAANLLLFIRCLYCSHRVRGPVFDPCFVM